MFKLSPKHKVIFKLDPRSGGLAGVGQMRGAYIMHQKQKIGRIHRNSMHMGAESCKYKVGFPVTVDGVQWNWKYFNVSFDKMEDAQAWVLQHINKIIDKLEQDGYTIHPLTS